MRGTENASFPVRLFEAGKTAFHIRAIGAYTARECASTWLKHKGVCL